MKYLAAMLAFLVLTAAWREAAPAFEVNGFGAIEGRFFFKEPLYPGQDRHNGSVILAPEFYHESGSGSSLVFVPFLALDSGDPERSRFDIRELNALIFGDPWELRVGIGKIFWGATEFVHLVDIVNQTDLVEDIRGEDKLGQPMAHLSVPSVWGVFDFFVLPYFRERTFPGPDGRLRPAIAVDTDHPLYESSAAQNHVDWACRYSRAFNFGDIGIYYFQGTGRDPVLIPSLNVENQPVLLPYYQQMDQAGLDAQVVAGNWLWKLEALHQHNSTEDFNSATGGFEYTFFGLAGTSKDLGLIVEFAYDDRGSDSPAVFDQDLLFGLRLGFNDIAGSRMLLGISHDIDNRGNVLQLEASRRLRDNVRIFLQGWGFFNVEPGDNTLYSIREDGFIRLQIFYYF